MNQPMHAPLHAGTASLAAAMPSNAEFDQTIRQGLDRSRDAAALTDFKRRLQSPEDMAKLISQRLQAATRNTALNNKHADHKYMSAMSFLYDDATLRGILQSNARSMSDDDIAAVLSRIESDDSFLPKYVQAAFAFYMSRHESEYRYINLFNVDSFPYDYLSRYAYKGEPAAVSPGRLAIDFIYCIKNRQARTRASLRSLDRAVREYAEAGHGRLDIRAVVVEDVSKHMLDLSGMHCAMEVEHIVVDTDLAWTRSGLLNVGIKHSKTDLLAFVDADFLFHDAFVTALDRVTQHLDVAKNVIAANLIETECHTKNGLIYSKGSPYSYMWMAPRKTAQAVHGFDEGYTGHGFEDRDFEMKLVRIGGLTVCDTASIDPKCAVLHLSHNSRDGYERHSENRTRYQQRQNSADLGSLIQPVWGEQEVIARNILPAAAPRTAASQISGEKTAGRTVLTPSQDAQTCRTLYMVISCQAYTARYDLLKRYYDTHLRPGDKAVFVVGGSDRDHFSAETGILQLKAGDMYEDLPEKVLRSIRFCAENFRFRNLIKVDDDVIINFDLMNTLLDNSRYDYFGKMIPSRRGAKPSPTWHFGKVTERSKHFNKPFAFDGGPPNWACGGMYAMSARAAGEIARASSQIDPTDYLYEDHMIGCILNTNGVDPVFIEETPNISSFKWIQTDLREVMNAELTAIADAEAISKTAGFHCGPFPPLYPMPHDKCMQTLNLFISVVGKRSPVDRSGYASAR